MPQPTEYRTTSVQRLDLFYRQAGPRDGETIVFLPGFPSSSAQYQPLIDRLSDRFRCIAVDYPGFGYSSTPPVDQFTYTFDALAARTEELLIDKLALDRFWLYMFDFGAPVGLRIAARNADRIAGPDRAERQCLRRRPR